MTALSLPLRRPSRRAARLLTEGWRTLYWGTMTALSALLIYNALPFFSFADDVPFLLEKGHLVQQPVWRIGFYLHVAGGVVCLLAALPLFSRTLLRRVPKVHRVLGYAYVISVLGLVVPAGLYMSLYAKGGFWGRFGFLAIGFTLLYTTWRGFERVRARDFVNHKAWMIRSYAMAASAISFRVFYLGLYALEIPNEYVLGIWMSFLVNAAVAECLISRRKGTRA